MARKLQLRRGTAAQWTTANPILAVGEPGFEVDTLRMKLGDGSTAWTSLAYVGGAGNAIAALSALTPAAGKVPYFTGASAASQVDSTSYGRSLLNVADEAALKSLINAEGGTDFATPSALSAGLLRAMPVGGVIPYAGSVEPSGWLFCYGQSVSRTTYSALYDAICKLLGDAAITINTPGVVTITGHGLTVGDRVRFFTTGSLPTGLAVETDYFVSNVVDANQFSVAASFGGASINTTGSQSGTHSVRRFPYGAGSSTTFAVPDLRDRVAAGRGNMGGTAAGRLTNQADGIEGDVLGRTGGLETDTMARSDLPNDTVSTTTNGNHTHSHSWPADVGISGGSGGVRYAFNPSGNTTGAAGDHSHTFALNGGVAQTAMNNVQPTIMLNYIIFADV
jgi:microcystin-dependent protein